ncbi:hypothetical protein GCM10025870_07140 [Agromyces marinus]|uniref:DUF2993 domain-containing protein n=1 Tax=Agromyces marinus TaxID=1389020 RepID=A0ABM8GYR8_9MICO|nr:DUF2993 domain-containing protein [Agromyces marinus]BDZ53641.1 hypothetical protein GCM10025870_07140 [Agromyces marinus]
MNGPEADTVPLEPAPRADAAPKRRPSVAVVVLIVLAVLAALVLVVETVGRGIAERQVAASIVDSLPPGVDGEVEVEIHGTSALWQALTGRMDEMTASASDLDVHGIPVDVTVTARGVPLAEGARLGRAEIEASIDADAARTIAAEQGLPGEIALGEGTIAYEDERTFFGLPIGFSVTAEPRAAGTASSCTRSPPSSTRAPASTSRASSIASSGATRSRSASPTVSPRACR